MNIYTYNISHRISEELELPFVEIPVLSDQTFSKLETKQTDKEYSAFKGKKHLKESNTLRSKAMSKLKWWNNGTINRRSVNQPEGYKPGRIVNYEYKLSEEGKANLGCPGKPITTPYGVFNNITEASNILKMTWDQVKYRLDNKDGWKYNS